MDFSAIWSVARGCFRNVWAACMDAPLGRIIEQRLDGRKKVSSAGKVDGVLDRDRGLVPRRRQTQASVGAVWSLTTAPVFTVPAVSTSMAWHSAVADVLCASPFGITNISPGPTETLPSRK